MKKIISKWYLLIILGFSFVAGILFFACGENSVIAVHDNLDLFIPQYKMMRDTHTFFAHDVSVGFLGFITRDVLPSEFNLYTLLYVILPPYYAYIVGYFIKIAIATLGAFFLSKTIFISKAPRYESIACLTGFAYGILNLFPNFGICFASLPLLVLIIYKILVKPTFWWYLALFLYPLVSYFSYFGFFIIGYLVLYFFIRWIRTRHFPWQILIAVFVISLGYVLCEYRLFYEMLFSDTETIRDGMVIGSCSLAELPRLIWEGIAIGDMHTESLQLYFIIPVSAITLVVQTVLYIKNKELKKIFKDPFYQVLLFIIFNGVIYGLYYSENVRDVFETICPPLSGFQFGRTNFFNPFLWYVELFLVARKLYDISEKKVMPKIVANAIIVIAIMITVFSNTRYNDFYHTALAVVKGAVKNEKPSELTYKEFYAEDLFEKAKADIGYCGQWSAAYGFYPAVLEYNGINTIDGYLGFYSQFYKDEFRQAIAPALERIPESKAYYDDWGARCYLYSGTHPSITNAYRNYEYEEEELFLDTDEFKDLDGRYIFSRIRLTNAAEKGFTLLGEYEDDDTPYKLYVYVTTSRFKEKERSAVPYEDRAELTYNADFFQEAYDKATEMAEEANAYKEEHEDMDSQQIVDALGREEEVLALYDEMVDEITKLATVYSISSVEYYKDVADEEADERSNEIYEDLLDLSDQAGQTISVLARSPYEVSLCKVLNSSIVEGYKDYEEMTDEEKENEIKEKSLEKEYEQASVENYYFDYNNVTYDLQMLEEAFGEERITLEEYFYVLEGIYDNKAAVMGEIYLELIQLRDKMAKDEGYDNYAEYAYERNYIRDYTVDDVKDLCKELGKGSRYFIRKINDMKPLEEYDPGYIYDDDTETFMALLPYMGKIDPELSVAMEHLLDCGLYDLSYSEDKPNMGFTVPMNYYGDAYIFDSPLGVSDDIFTFVHEFGHYANYYYSAEGILESKTNLDLAEITSQALEMLFCKHYKDIYGNKSGAYLEFKEVSKLISQLPDIAITAEFEIYAYEHPDSTLEDLSEAYNDIAKKHGYYYDTFMDHNYLWVDTTHIFQQPCYYISYLTSALSSLELYTLSYEDEHAAIEKYMMIDAYPSYYPYKATMDYTGLSDVFKKGNTRKIIKGVYEILKKKEEELEQ